jgi:hypothetical protein
MFYINAIYLKFIHCLSFLYKNYNISEMGLLPSSGREHMKRVLLC